MLFTSALFLPFFVTVWAVYWTLQNNDRRKVWLLVISALFYSFWDWRLLGLVILVILNTYTVPLLVASPSLRGGRRVILLIGIIGSLTILGIFKYFNFFIQSINAVVNTDIVVAELVLPIGISFYTFHSLSYMIDSYRGRLTPTKNFVDVA